MPNNQENTATPKNVEVKDFTIRLISTVQAETPEQAALELIRQLRDSNDFIFEVSPGEVFDDSQFEEVFIGNINPDTEDFQPERVF